MTTFPYAADLATERQRELMAAVDAHSWTRAGRPRHSRAGPSTVRIRPVRRNDAALLCDLFARLSSQTRFDRYLFTKPALTDAELSRPTSVEHRDHEVLVCVTRMGRRSVAVAEFIRDSDDPLTADVAIVVADGWQERGIGSRVAACLAARASDVGIAYFTALVAGDNLRARSLLRKVGDVALVSGDGATMSYRVTLPGIAGGRPRRRAERRALAPCVA